MIVLSIGDYWDFWTLRIIWYKYGDLALQVGGVSKIGTIKYGLECRGTQSQEGLHWQGPAATVN
jgi:hypothetical protein